MAFSQQSKPLTIFKILREALKLPTKNPTLILPILLLSFLSSSLLFTFFDLSIKPVIVDLTSNSRAIASLDPNSPEYASTLAAILKDTKELFAIESIFIVASFIVSSLTTVATINAFTTSKLLLCRLKGPMITKLCVALLTWGYFFLLLAALGIFMLIASGPAGPSMIVIVSGVILSLFGMLLYLYLTTVWSVSVVISVVEDGCYGLRAISKAGEVIGGRRMQGVVIAMIQWLVSGVVYGSYNVAKAYIDPSSPTVVQLGIGVVWVAVGVVVAAFDWAVVTVFYVDCNGVERPEINRGFVYGSVPTEAEAALLEKLHGFERV